MPHVVTTPASKLPVASLGVLSRQHTRLSVDGGVLRLAVRPEFRGRRALLVDVSKGGIGFLLPEALATDTVIVFEIQGMAGGDSVSRLARVRNCRPHPVPADAPWAPPAPLVANVFRRVFGMSTKAVDGWLVGCEFERPLSDLELKQFLVTLHSMPVQES